VGRLMFGHKTKQIPISIHAKNSQRHLNILITPPRAISNDHMLKYISSNFQHGQIDDNPSKEDLNKFGYK
jgi:hypothetical protein